MILINNFKLTIYHKDLNKWQEKAFTINKPTNNFFSNNYKIINKYKKIRGLMYWKLISLLRMKIILMN